ncbi:DnaJ-domain-containing protein [Massarina eburnea CBS 473.64]|uniref:DnaJ-domain-containing protein n=1 Tax=Massarina eburnea CBS 473.64 TaxID=1395130 RepID=A0A6A6RKY9_9PLEO|nr:DnaJ-domain-containing protein [Massarina eburnea CBS 473.64]
MPSAPLHTYTSDMRDNEPPLHSSLPSSFQTPIHGASSISTPPSSALHTSSRHLSEQVPNHYSTLDLAPSASPAEIKRQFYALSKTHHPDRNPNDPTASTRFVAISEAYHILSVPEKRAQHDAQLSQTRAQGSGRWDSVWRGTEQPQGSYSSASFAGSRPASGLNKKRSTFRGPPPSFYRGGGYGSHGAKRAEYAHHTHEGGAKSAGQESYGGFNGFGPGQTSHGNEVPHFDDKRHKQTHDHVHEHIHARRRRSRPTEIPDDDRGGQLANFLLVSGAVGVIAWSAKAFGDRTEKKKKDKI